MYRSIFTSSPLPLVPSTPSPFQLHVFLFCCFSSPGPMSVGHIDMVVENSLGSLPLAMAPKENNVFFSPRPTSTANSSEKGGASGEPSHPCWNFDCLDHRCCELGTSCQDMHVNCAMATSCQEVSIGQLFFPSTSS